jgi:hypothetical protein
MESSMVVRSGTKSGRAGGREGEGEGGNKRIRK